MHSLHFCRDGILRRSMTIRSEDEKTFQAKRLPVLAWESGFDEGVFLKALHDVIVLEEGLTVGEMFRNLAPWAKIMTGVACMDFPAFLEEMNTPADPLNDLSRIRLSYSMQISPVPGFEKCEKADPDNIFNIGPAKKTGLLSTEEGWSMSAMVAEDHLADYEGEESVSLSFSPLSEWQHLPIIIEKDGVFIDETPWCRNAVYLGTDQSLTQGDHPNVETSKSSSGDVCSHRIRITAPNPTFFDAIVRGFLWDVGFFYSPAKRNETCESVKSSVEQIEHGLSGEDSPPQGTLDDEIDEDAEDRAIMQKIIKVAEEMKLPVISGTSWCAE